jgi:K+-transporting ATPase A subunit
MVVFSAIAIAVPAGLSGLNNPSAHGLSEILTRFLRPWQ